MCYPFSAQRVYMFESRDSADYESTTSCSPFEFRFRRNLVHGGTGRSQLCCLYQSTSQAYLEG